MKERYIDLFKERKPVLIMSLPANNLEAAKAAIDNGADVIKMHVNLEHHASQHHFGSLMEEKSSLEEILRIAGNMPRGIVAGQNAHTVLSALPILSELGFDFLSLYTQHTPPELLEREDFARMLALDYQFDISLLPYIEKKADVIEASIMHPDSYGEPLSVLDIVKYERICSQTALPVVVPTQHEVRPEEVRSLVSAGVSGIMIGAIVTGTEPDSIGRAVAAFRNEIDKL